jgi:energy-coupling factor transporter ATP-binding protein EcfA2
MALPVSNPFATRFTRPGCIESRDATGGAIDVGEVRERLRGLGGTAAIVGPHGSGKSTLLVHLAATMEASGEVVSRVRLRSLSDVPAVWAAIRHSAAGGTACIDSWESIGPVARGLLRVAARASGCGLLVTSHHGAGMPELIRCGTSESLLRSIVRALPGHASWHGTLIFEADIEAAFASHGGNLRESLYELYDRFEARAGSIRVGGGDGPDGRDGCAGGGCGIHEFADGFSYVGAPERNLGLGG